MKRTDRPLVFVDTNVIISFLRGDDAATKLFDDAATSRMQLVINPVVLQQIMLSADQDTKERFADTIQPQLRMIPINPTTSAALLERARLFRNKIFHSNELLIFASAQSCDYIVTYDKDIFALGADVEGVRPVTPEELIRLLSVGG